MRMDLEKHLFSMRHMMLLFLLLLIAGIFALSCSGGKIDRHTAEITTPDSLLGKWHELARFDHRFERGLTDVEATYSLLPDGTIRVENSGYDAQKGERRTAIGHAKFTNDPGRLRVSFFWKFYSDYNILERGPEGKWMLIGSYSPRYLWILARTPTLPESEFNHILELARLRGYDTSKLLISKAQQAGEKS